MHGIINDVVKISSDNLIVFYLSYKHRFRKKSIDRSIFLLFCLINTYVFFFSLCITACNCILSSLLFLIWWYMCNSGLSSGFICVKLYSVFLVWEKKIQSISVLFSFNDINNQQHEFLFRWQQIYIEFYQWLWKDIFECP